MLVLLTFCRQHWRTASSKFRPELVETFFKAFYREANVLRKQVPDALISINVQVLTKAEVAKSQGDNNAFGLKVEDAPLCCKSIPSHPRSLHIHACENKDINTA